ncbi:metallophosphatase [Leptolyngbya boryana CZ1]|uniref:Metallophosphatase n=2 Tax=Leptolyngbya TaxID=47251 RepID=A0AA96WYN9_LEPBY|nr:MULTISPECIES: metallophosphatase [Leptolyngbya]WNZ47766.1 metallophosphatase [Leptolyngbya boryana CZ1]
MMSSWAILSGIEGNLAAYEAVLKDIQRQRVDALFVLGDVISPRADNEKLINRLTSPRRGELVPQVCQGWWEEQLLVLHGLGRVGEPTELIGRYGIQMTKKLWDSVPRNLVRWVQSLEFGIFELDCLLIHGSTVSVSDELTPETDPIQMLDRAMRMDANYLFCGRSGLAFEYEIESGGVLTSVTTLDRRSEPEPTSLHPRKIIGVGNVGRTAGQAIYTIYNPNTNALKFCTVRYDSGKGFQIKR